MLPRVPPSLRVLFACVATLSALSAPSAAVAAPGGYTGEAPVNSQSEEERSQALKTALANVVIAQSGDSGALARSDVAKAIGQAERYVLQYQYRRNPGNGGDGGARMTLVAQFDSTAVDQLLRKLGLGAGDDPAAQADTTSEATVWVDGIHTADDYARVIGYFGKNNFVRSAQPTAARGDGLLLRLSLSTDLGHFLEAVGMERTLSVVQPATPTAGVDATLALAP